MPAGVAGATVGRRVFGAILTTAAELRTIGDI